VKIVSVFALAAVMGACIVSEADPSPYTVQTGEQQVIADAVCVYKDANYLGFERCYKAGDEISDLRDQNKTISSIRVSGRATVTVYENIEFRGRSAEFSSDVDDLARRLMGGRSGWSDRIRSLKVTTSSRIAAVDSDLRAAADEPHPTNGVCIYDRPNFEGRSECWSQNQSIADLGRHGNWGGRISSIRVFGRAVAVVYQDTGYRGEVLSVDKDIADLAAIRGPENSGTSERKNGSNKRVFRNWDRQISSIQVR